MGWSALLRWFAPYLMRGMTIAGALAGLWFIILHVEASARREQKAVDAAAVRDAGRRAEISALKAARAIEAGYDRGTKEANDKLLPALADARDRLAVYVARMRDQADKGDSGQGDLSATADAASLLDGPVTLAGVADLDICTENTIRLKSVQEWWATVSAGGGESPP